MTRLYSETLMLMIAKAREFAIASSGDETWTISFAILKLLEEQGELSEALLCEAGAMPHKVMKETSHGEAIDAILCIVDSFRNEPVYPVVRYEEISPVQEPMDRVNFFKDNLIKDLAQLVQYAIYLDSCTNEQKALFWTKPSESENLRLLHDRTIHELVILAEDCSGKVNAIDIIQAKLKKWDNSNKLRNSEPC